MHPVVGAFLDLRRTGLTESLVPSGVREARNGHGHQGLVAGLKPGDRVLDIGCGTGSLALMLKRMVPGAEVYGLDEDETLLATARRRAARQGLLIAFRQGRVTAPPFPWGSFDRIASQLFLHRLSPDDQRRCLWECFELLSPAGGLRVEDWLRPDADLQRDMEEAGFRSIEETHRWRTVFGRTLAAYRAVKPA